VIAPSQDECRPRSGCTQAAVDFPAHYAPFVWQVGSRLLLMDRDDQVWVVAELIFHARFGHYVERRRVAYDSAREAAGVLLATMITSDQTSQELLAAALEDWLSEFAAVA
jgi:hypothetical protein